MCPEKETHRVRDDESGMRLDRWFKCHYPDITHACLSKLLRTGQVRLSGKRATGGTRLESGHSIRIPPGILYRTAAENTPRTRPLSMKDKVLFEAMKIFEDDDVLIINKPSGLAVQGGSKTFRHVDGILASLSGEGDFRFRLIHRLDRDTSGILVIAKTRLAASGLGDLFARHRVQKFYLALVLGLPRERVGYIDLPLAKIASHGGERIVAVRHGKENEAQDAVTYYAVLGHAGSDASCVLLQPETGRQHQLRVHMAAMGHPIWGDKKYGKNFLIDQGKKNKHGSGTTHLSGFLHLHASRTCFPHPCRKGEIDISAPLPEHMRNSFSFFKLDPYSKNWDNLFAGSS